MAVRSIQLLRPRKRSSLLIILSGMISMLDQDIRIPNRM